jgi:holo-[acyl-carrier protein] synthase
MKLGVDLLAYDELDRLVRRRWFNRYVFAEVELGDAGTLTGVRRREFLAGRFAAKEAVLKVLGVGMFAGVAPRDIALRRDPGGGVDVVLRDTASRSARSTGVAHLSVSITHKRGWVVAVAVGWPAEHAAATVVPTDQMALVPLTHRQRQVAELVSEGLTNRQIADRLFVTQKTVEMHLAQVFTRLGVSNRVGVARVITANWQRRSRTA